MNIFARASTFFLLFILMVAATVRTTGLDYPVYLNEFLDPVNSLSSGEVGYVLLIKTVGLFFGFWFVLLLANAVFLLSHMKLLARLLSVAHALVFLFYVSYLGLFLIYGSPRRLIAYSLVTMVILAITFDPSEVKQKLWKYMLIVGCAAAFHVSAIVFFPVLVVFGQLNRTAASGWQTAALILAGVLGLYGLYAAGGVDYITTKILYYALEAAGEQAYLEDVPSVTTGLLKRAVAIGLIWFGTRGFPASRNPAMVFCLIEIVVYGSLGVFSPVLSVVATYFAIGYVLPIMNMQSPAWSVSPRRLALIAGAAVYFIPTSVGLLRLFGDFYV
jgi:hypothetical protein